MADPDGFAALSSPGMDPPDLKLPDEAAYVNNIYSIYAALVRCYGSLGSGVRSCVQRSALIQD
jgi:hypothetical protein